MTVSILCSNALDAALRELAPACERSVGQPVAITFKSTNQIIELVKGGEVADLMIAGRSAIDELAAAGRIVGETAVDLATSGIGVCVKAGAPWPDIGTVDAFKRTLLAAKSVAHTRTGQSGSYFAALIDRLGIGDAVRAKAKVQTGGIIGEVVARGEAEIGIQQISEVLAVPGVDLVGPFPPEIQKVTVFSAGAHIAAQHPEAAGALIAFLSSNAAVAVMKAKGLEPVAGSA